MQSGKQPDMKNFFHAGKEHGRISKFASHQEVEIQEMWAHFTPRQVEQRVNRRWFVEEFEREIRRTARHFWGFQSLTHSFFAPFPRNFLLSLRSLLELSMQRKQVDSIFSLSTTEQEAAVVTWLQDDVNMQVSCLSVESEFRAFIFEHCREECWIIVSIGSIFNRNHLGILLLWRHQIWRIYSHFRPVMPERIVPDSRYFFPDSWKCLHKCW